MLTKEYRICMPLRLREYRVGQLFMIARTSAEQSAKGDSADGVEVVHNNEHHDPKHGKGQFTEKRIFPASRLPAWARALVPRSVFVTERAFNYFPYTYTEYSCSLVPRLSVKVHTRFEENAGTNENCFDLSESERAACEVDWIDIVNDSVSARHYRESEDLRHFRSAKTGRGPFAQDWLEHCQPVMCSYKHVEVSFEVWGLQSRAEDFIHAMLREILLLAHRQAVAWIDEWIDMDEADVRAYEERMQRETNERMRSQDVLLARQKSLSRSASSPDASPQLDDGQTERKGWFAWS